MVVEANYIGTEGHQLINSQNYNRFVGDLLLNGRFTGFNQSFSSVTIRQSTSNSIYHGGTLQIKRAFMAGFTLQAAYTVGKAIDDTGAWQNVLNRRAERSVTAFDAPQKLSLIGLWEMPFFKSKARLYRVLGGWQLSGFAILQAGNPLTVTRGGSPPPPAPTTRREPRENPPPPLTTIKTSPRDPPGKFKGNLKVKGPPPPPPPSPPPGAPPPTRPGPP